MANNEGPATESTHLLPRDKRLESVYRDVEAQSIISSHVSRDEQMLRETAVGERLSYNDYTTIDWLHDLVGVELSMQKPHTDRRNRRSKTRFATALSTTAKASATLFYQHGTRVRGGSLQPSSVPSRPASHS
jgi:hypothetical protein